MLKPVKKSQEFKGAISEATNYGLEASLVGVPLWLQQNGHDSDAQAVMRYISRQPQELFVRHIHRVLWTAYGALSSRDLPPSEAWLQQVLSELGEWSTDESARTVTPGLLDELAEKGTCRLTVGLGDSPMSLVNDVTDELWALYRKRQVIHAVEDLYRQVTTEWNPSTEQDVAASIEDLQRRFNQRPEREETASTFNELVQADIKALERQLDGEEPERILTGFLTLDRLIGGFDRGNELVLAARPQMGKTSLALDIALHMAKQGRLVVYFSFEMTRRELVRRIVSKECRLNVLRLRHGNLEPWQMDQYKDQFGKGSNLPLIIDEDNYTPSGIETRIRDFNRMASPARVEFLIIDHLQLMGSRDPTRYERRDRQLATYTAGLKDMAKRLSVPVLVLSQLNRQSENRPLNERLPRLSDLRESGAIEADADVVLGLYRKYPDTQADADQSHADLIILKNRSGPTGRLSLTWIPHLAKFSDPSGHQDGEEQALEPAPF